jgi:Ca-activated chloride channel family protein
MTSKTTNHCSRGRAATIDESKERPMNISGRIFQMWLVIFGSVVFSLVNFAQEPITQKRSGPTTRLSLIVTNSFNHSIDEVRKDDIQIFENGVPQTISLFEKDERPIDYALVVDNSGSFGPILEPAIIAARLVVNSNRDLDETFIERFISNDKIETVQEFTSDKSKLINGLESLYVEKGQSAVVDALYLAVQHTAGHRPDDEKRRRAVVVFTDCEERASYYSSDRLFRLIRENNVQVFVVGVVELLGKQRGPLIIKNSREKAEKLANRIAEESGGRVFFPKDGKELKGAVEEIVHDLHTQYLVGYERTIKPTKGFRKITVSITTKSSSEPLLPIIRLLQ